MNAAFFDHWVRMTLHRKFDAVACEPVPDCLLHCLERGDPEREGPERRDEIGLGGA
ncbi:MULTISPECIES: hypothetical protein [Nguyenibacter]|uniref:Uncharacterized protein n=1 Tax=Nguyenibacter vanlangensis TaxID=1216886 RepID=A0A7Y7IZG4_9PROT|nr:MULTISPECIES: hypothetical protein [Nguyenibacter]NVN13085.1 hypothetical protein [Nguyenibacter vanlangensis]WRH86935.1 hypothetical protein QN315_13160 [Nguyenibacter sp. L1]